MAVSRCRCPECDSLVRPAEPVPAGKRIRCPSCDRAFVVEDDRDRDAEERSSGRHRRPDDRSFGGRRDWSHREPLDDEDRDERPIRRPRPRRKKKESSTGLVIGLILGLVLLLAGLGVGGYFLIRSSLGNRHVTRATYATLKPGSMTRREVEDVFGGSGSRASQSELSDIDMNGGRIIADDSNLVKWTNGDDTIYAWFDGKDKQSRLFFTAFVRRENDRIVNGAFNFNTGR